MIVLVLADQEHGRGTVLWDEEEEEEENGNMTCLSRWKRKNRITKKRRSFQQSEFNHATLIIRG